MPGYFGPDTNFQPQVINDGRAVIYSVGYDGMATADDAIIEGYSFATGEQKVLHEGGYYARYVPTGHLVFIRDGTLFGMTFDAEGLELELWTPNWGGWPEP